MVTETESTTGATGGEIYSGNTPRGNAARRFTISGDVIARVVSDLPDREREAIKWLAGYCMAKNISHRDVADRLKKPDGTPYHADSLYQTFTGRREPGQLGPLVDAIETFRRLVEENQVKLQSDFVEHALTRKIEAYCDKARRRQKIGLIYGGSQIGKTTTLTVYKETHNHGETIYIRMPTRASVSCLLLELALVLNVSTGLRGTELRRAIINCFDSRMLLIIDEAHEGTVGALNFCREIHDRRKCGVVFAGTDVFRQTLAMGLDKKNFRQLMLRALPPLRLPNVLGRRDLDAFARAYDLGPAADEEISARVTFEDDDGKEVTKTITKAPAVLQREVIETDALGRWCMILQEAREMAQEKKRAITWGAVLVAWHRFEQLGQFDAGEAA